jgi:5-methylcytosine-specific restriction endonuclease McrA
VLFIPRGRAALGLLAPRRMRVRHRYRHSHHRPGCPPGCRRHDRKRCPSSRISDRQHRIVLFADRYRCAFCRRRQGTPVARLEQGVLAVSVLVMHVDHIRPWAGGYLTVLWNLMTLCQDCNLAKSNYSRDRGGYEHYRRAARTPAALSRARMILAAELRHRRNPLRWVLGIVALAAA